MSALGEEDECSVNKHGVQEPSDHRSDTSKVYGRRLQLRHVTRNRTFVEADPCKSHLLTLTVWKIILSFTNCMNINSVNYL